MISMTLDVARRIFPIGLLGCSTAFLAFCFSSSMAKGEESLAHPFHICIGEMEWNQESGNWEVALRVHPDDLQRAVSRLAKERIELQLGDEPQPQVMSYLQSHLYLRAGEKPAHESSANPQIAEVSHSTLTWLGSEMEKGWMWVYLELTPPKGEGPLHLVHEILLDDVEKQSNTMVVIRGDKKQSLRFWKDMRERPFENAPASTTR